MNLEVTFFLANGQTIGHVETSYSSVEDAMDRLESILGTKTTYKAGDDIVISMMHVTHFIVKEHNGGEDDEPEGVPVQNTKEFKGRTVRDLFFMGTDEFIEFMGDDIPKTNSEFNLLARELDLPDANLYALLHSHGLGKDIK